jgi:FkbM family methyltransferase
MLCHPLVGHVVARRYQNILPYQGVAVDVGHPAIQPRTRASIFWGLYESAELRFVQRYIDDSLDVIELGSSLGAISSQIAARLHGKRALVCVEANPDLTPLVTANVRRNAPHTSLHVYAAAIAYGTPTVVLQRGTYTTGSRIVTAAELPGAGTFEVPALRLGDLVERHFTGPYALVADIEGAEFDMFVQDAAVLQRCARAIVELHLAQFPSPRSSLHTVDEVVTYLDSTVGLSLVARHGPVCVFERRMGW